MTTCAANASDFVYSNTGADHCIDYETNELIGCLESFDFVLNAATVGQHRDQTPEFGSKLLRKWKNDKYVTLSAPILNNTDSYGLLVGSGLSAIKAIEQTAYAVKEGKAICWAFYWPNTTAVVDHKDRLLLHINELYFHKDLSNVNFVIGSDIIPGIYQLILVFIIENFDLSLNLFFCSIDG